LTIKIWTRNSPGIPGRTIRKGGSERGGGILALSLLLLESPKGPKGPIARGKTSGKDCHTYPSKENGDEVPCLACTGRELPPTSKTAIIAASVREKEKMCQLHWGRSCRFLTKGGEQVRFRLGLSEKGSSRTRKQKKRVNL